MIEHSHHAYRGYSIRVLLLGRGAAPYMADICDDDGKPVDGTEFYSAPDFALRDARALVDLRLRWGY